MRYLVVLLVLSGCAVQPKPFSGPNGRQAYAMECSGEGRTMHDCLVKAGDLCQRGYDVVTQSSGPSGAIVGGYGAVGARESLAIECR
jgi:hypothetical protein